ncbi:hypothetical protein J6590_067066 [Homalodisca vitripennis]|nr:hypothetical protein J6590_067066 [Homalodisca vitripennis]
MTTGSRNVCVRCMFYGMMYEYVHLVWPVCCELNIKKIRRELRIPYRYDIISRPPCMRAPDPLPLRYYIQTALYESFGPPTARTLYPDSHVSELRTPYHYIISRPPCMRAPDPLSLVHYIQTTLYKSSGPPTTRTLYPGRPV